MSKSVTFWVPELLDSQRVEEASESLKSISLPWLSRLLTKADALPIKANQTFHQTASYLFHQPAMLPIAPLLASVELNSADNQLFWLKIDPVQLIADRDSLVLIPAEDLVITEDESRALLTSFNEHFAEENLQIEYGSKNSWYLKIVQPVDIKTVSIEALSYKPLNDAYPKGNAATYWKKLINETQMLFFSHPVNEARREKGQPEINSIWVWGEGQLNKNQIKYRDNVAIHSNNLYLNGLAKQTGAQRHSETKNHQGGGAESTHDLICLDSITESLPHFSADEWLECLLELDKQWFEPLYKDLKTGKIDSLLIDLGMAKRYHIQPKHLNRFWRFLKPITKF